MKDALVVQLPDGSVELRDWPVWAYRVIEELLVLSDPELPDGPVRDRLFQVANEDGADEWRKNVHPELFALLASAREIVAKDLVAAKRGRDGSLERLKVPREHLPGWISAIQTARLHLAAAFGVDGDAMRKPLDELSEDLRGVVLRIDLLAELQFHFVHGVDPESTQAPPGLTAEDTEPDAGAGEGEDDNEDPEPPHA